MAHQVLIIPGLGDISGYIERSTRHWPEKYELEPTIYPFGWFDPLETYDAKLLTFEQTITKLGSVAVIGISAGGSLAINALRRWPDHVSCAVSICGAIRIDDPNNSRLVSSPLLRHSIEEVGTNDIGEGSIMTISPLYDGVVNPKNVPVEGATNLHMNTVGHVFSIVWALYTRDKAMADFITKRHQ